MRRHLLLLGSICFLLLSQTSLAATAYTDVPWKKLKPSAMPIELHSIALELQDYANAGDVYYIYYMLHAAHFNKRQKVQLQERLLKADNSLFNDAELTQITQRLYTSIETQFPSLFSPQQTWKLVHHRKYKKRHFLLYRIDNHEGAYDYVDFEFTLQQGKWLLIDWYTRSTDTWMSAVFSRGFQLVYNAQQHHNQASTALLNYLEQRDAQLIANFDALSATYQEDPILQASLMGFASKKAPESVPAAYERLNRLAAPNKFLIFKLNHAYQEGDLAGALQLCDYLQDQLGGDSDLALLQAEILYQRNDTKRADKVIASAIRKHPESQQLIYTALVLFAYYDKYPQAVLALDILKQDFDVVLDAEALGQISGLEAFIESKEFMGWLASVD